MLNRPFEGNLHNDLGIAEATDKTIESFLVRNYDLETRDLLTALNNQTVKTDSPEGRLQLKNITDQFLELLATYRDEILKFVEESELLKESFPEVPSPVFYLIIRTQTTELIERLAGKISLKLGNAFTEKGLITVSKLLLQSIENPHTTLLIEQLDASVEELNRMSQARFERATQAEQADQFKQVVSQLATNILERANDKFENLIPEEA